nr:SDR family oxidoreductase [Planomicrobium sp. YIM 101495]
MILGATGRVGSELVEQALRGGHHVNVLVRSPEKIQRNVDNLSIFQGNVLVKNDVIQAMHGMDVVVSALNTDGTTTLSESMPLIIEAMQETGITRIITIGTAGILQSRVTPEVLRYQSSESKRKLTRAAEEHHKTYEILAGSSLDWTIVCPTYLPDGERKGKYRVERDSLPEGGARITVADTAEFAYKQIDSLDFNKVRVGISY